MFGEGKTLVYFCSLQEPVRILQGWQLRCLRHRHSVVRGWGRGPGVLFPSLLKLSMTLDSKESMPELMTIQAYYSTKVNLNSVNPHVHIFIRLL